MGESRVLWEAGGRRVVLTAANRVMRYPMRHALTSDDASDLALCIKSLVAALDAALAERDRFLNVEHPKTLALFTEERERRQAAEARALAAEADAIEWMGQSAVDANGRKEAEARAERAEAVLKERQHHGPTKQEMVLGYIQAHQGCKTRDVAEATGLKTATAKSVIRALRKNGLLELPDLTSDGRLWARALLAPDTEPKP